MRVVESCWLWTGALNGSGYGTIGVGARRVGAHRFAYERFIGPIPEGLDLDHLCRVRHCVNPEHLEPVTRRMNLVRGQGLIAENVTKTHCNSGHEFTPENTHYDRGGRSRRCRACRRLRVAELRARRAVAA